MEEVTYFTDEEYRILLSALTKERKICKEVDERFKHGVLLAPIVDSIERKLNAIQYKRDKKLDRIRNIKRKRPRGFDKLTEEYRLK